jgi:hypothetical protein
MRVQTILRQQRGGRQRAPASAWGLVLAAQRTKITGTETLAPGHNVVRVEFLYDGGGLGEGTTVSILVNDKLAGKGRIEATQWTGKYSPDETFDIGEDSGSTASEAYDSPNRFAATITKIVIDSQPANMSTADQKKLQGAEREAASGTQ